MWCVEDRGVKGHGWDDQRLHAFRNASPTLWSRLLQLEGLPPSEIDLWQVWLSSQVKEKV